MLAVWSLVRVIPKQWSATHRARIQRLHSRTSTVIDSLWIAWINFWHSGIKTTGIIILILYRTNCDNTDNESSAWIIKLIRNFVQICMDKKECPGLSFLVLIREYATIIYSTISKDCISWEAFVTKAFSRQNNSYTNNQTILGNSLKSLEIIPDEGLISKRLVLWPS